MVEFLKLYKLKKDTLKTDLINVYPLLPIFISELLSPYSAWLFKELKSCQEKCKLKYVWSRNNKVAARKGDNTPVLVVRSFEDIQKIVMKYGEDRQTDYSGDELGVETDGSEASKITEGRQHKRKCAKMSIRNLPEVLQKKAIFELGEDVDRRLEDIHHIRTWLKQQPHLNVFMYKLIQDDQWILTFLRGCKFSLQKTKEKLDMFYTMKSLLPEFYKDRDPFRPDIQEILKLGLCLPLPSNQMEPQTILVRLSPEDPSLFKFSNVLKVSFMIIDILLRENDNFIISGQYGIQYFNNATIKHILHVDVSVCKKAMSCFYSAYPTRPKGAIFVNPPVYFEKFIATLKSWVPEKISKRVHVYNENNVNKLYEQVSIDSIPSDYGGNGPTIQELTDNWKKIVENHRDWFIEEEKYCSAEAKRIGKKYTSSDLFGVEGSFRKLCID
ncbi:hypothetical protein FQR65_LT11441 [Abscondita terminalis]|nr:hypothetical protein FQR65_LT11441 [Abscondita terminalis]